MRNLIAGEKIEAGTPVHIGGDGKAYGPPTRPIVAGEDILNGHMFTIKRDENGIETAWKLTSVGVFRIDGQAYRDIRAGETANYNTFNGRLD